MNTACIVTICGIFIILSLIPIIYSSVNLHDGCPKVLRIDCNSTENGTYEVWEIYNSSAPRLCGISSKCPNKHLCEEDECESKLMTSLLLGFVIFAALNLTIGLITLSCWCQQYLTEKRGPIGDEVGQWPC